MEQKWDRKTWPREVAVMGRFSTREFERMEQKSGQENMTVEERWPLWGGFQ